MVPALEDVGLILAFVGICAASMVTRAACCRSVRPDQGRGRLPSQVACLPMPVACMGAGCSDRDRAARRSTASGGRWLPQLIA